MTETTTGATGTPTGATTGTTSGTARTGVAPGTEAPDFTLKDNHGRTVRLSELRAGPEGDGRNVVLLFYPFAFTGVCTGELHALRDELPAFVNDDTQLLAVSTDSIHTLRVFAEQEGLEYPCCRTSGRTGGPHGRTGSSTRTRAARCAAPSSSTRRAWCAGRSSTGCRTPATSMTTSRPSPHYDDNSPLLIAVSRERPCEGGVVPVNRTRGGNRPLRFDR